MEILPSLITIFSSVITAIVAIYISKRRYEIRWVVLPPKSMMEIADEISERLVTTLDGQKITNLTKFTFILHNSGREPFDANSIVEPLKWSGPGTIFDVRVVATMPTVNLIIETSDSDLQISWQLFNQSCQALIEVICESASETDSGNITGQIKKVPEIKIKDINYFDEEEIRKRERKNISRSPKFSRFLYSENQSVFYMRFRWLLVTGYLAIVVYFMSHSYLKLFNKIELAYYNLIPISLSLLVLVLGFYFLRNPYSKLLKARSKNKSS